MHEAKLPAPVVLMIVADSNEPKDIVGSLREAGVLQEVRDLPFGDYWIESTTNLKPLVVERKTVDDLLKSLRERRIFDQLRAMKEFCDAEPRLLIEGDFYVLKFRNWADRSVQSLLWSIENEWNVQITHTRNKGWTVGWLVRWAKQRMGFERPKRVHPVRYVPKAGDLRAIQRGLVEGLPAVSGELAERLLRHFGSPLAVFNAPAERLVEVRGIGPERAKRIIEALRSEYV